MRYQLTSSGCAAASLVNSGRCIGKRWSQHMLARMLRDEGDGADEHDMLAVLEQLGVIYARICSSHRKESADWLRTHARGAPVILCVDDWEHWVAIIGMVGRRYLLADPTDEAWNRSENGVWALDESAVMRRWRAASKRRRDGMYYGISIAP